MYFGINRFPHSILWPQTTLKSAEAFISPVSDDSVDSGDGVLFLNQNSTLCLEPPELKIIQGDSLSAFCPPRVLSSKVLGSIFGQGPQIRKEIVEYTVQSGDTFKLIAEKFDVSLNTLLLSNDLSSSSKIKNGQTLIILPVSGLVHIAESGDTIEEIAKLYKASADEILEVNDLADESDVYIGDILVVPNGVMPKKAPVFPQTYLADNYFIFPAQGIITQTLHWYNGVDIANKCGTPIFAAAAGVVQKAKYGWNFGGGNIVTILHKDGVVSYYGHLLNIAVNSGDIVDVGQKIGLIGGQPGMDGAGISTGCHVHFATIGTKNPFSKYPLGYQMKYVQE